MHDGARESETIERRVVIVGAAGFTNLGDDAILAAMLAELCAALPTAHFVIASGDAALVAAVRPTGATNVATIAFEDAAIATALDTAALLIVGGGGFIYDYDARISAHNFLHGDPSLFYPHYRAILVAHSLGLPILVYGVGVGPLLTAGGRGLTRTILALASAITVRDPLSLAELRAAGLITPRPELTADPAVRLSPVVGAGTTGRSVGFVARAWLRFGENWTTSSAAYFERYLSWLAAGADHAVERWEATPVFIPLQRRYDDDRAIEERIIARMRHGARARIADDPPDHLALQATLGDLDALVSTRLHPLILAGVAGVPPIGVGISPKIRAFLDSLGLAHLALSPWIARDGDLNAALDLALGTPQPIRDQLRRGMAGQATAAARNPAIAASLLGAGAALARERTSHNPSTASEADR